MLLCQRGQSLLIPSPSSLLTLTLKLYHTHPRAGRAGAPRPPTFRKTNAPAGPFFADAFGFVTVHDGILKQRAGHAVAHARRRLKSLDRLYRVASLRHRHSLYSTTPTPPMGSDPLGSPKCNHAIVLHDWLMERLESQRDTPKEGKETIQCTCHRIWGQANPDWRGKDKIAECCRANMFSQPEML